MGLFESGQGYQRLAPSVARLRADLLRDPTTATLFTQRGLQVDSFALVDEAVGTVALGPLSVTTAKIGNTQVTNGKIADAAISTAKTALSSSATAGVAAGFLILRRADGTEFYVPAHLPP